MSLNFGLRTPKYGVPDAISPFKRIHFTVYGIANPPELAGDRAGDGAHLSLLGFH